MSDTTLRILSLEDLAVDAELVADALQRAGLSVEFQRVEDEAGFNAALDAGPPDAILADWTLPHFSGRAALAIAQRRCAEVPFVFVSGTIAESTAIEALRHGATDYVYKHQLELLGPVLTRALTNRQQQLLQRAAEQETQRSNARFAALLSAMPDGVMETDVHGAVIWGNAQWIAFMGRPLEQCLGYAWLGAVHPDDVAPLETKIRNALETGQDQLRSFRVVGADGRVRWLSGFGAPLRDPAGTVTGWVVTMTDVSAIKQAQEDVAQGAQRLALALEAAGEGILDWHLDSGVLIVSPECYNILGYPPAAIPADVAAWRALIHPDDLDAYNTQMQRYIAEDGVLTLETEYRVRRQDGSWCWICGRRRKVAFDARGVPTRIIGTVLDISARKCAEQRIARADAMYRDLSQINQAIVHLDNADALFEEVCRVIAGSGELGLAWIGMFDASGVMRKLASAGPAASLLDDPEGAAFIAAPQCALPFIGPIDPDIPVARDGARTGAPEPEGVAPASLNQYASLRVPLAGGGMRGALIVHAPEAGYFDATLLALLTEIGGDISFALDNFERERQRLQASERLSRSLEDTLEMVADTLAARDPYTAGHQRQVAKLAAAIGRELGMDEERLHGLYLGGIVHDIGKIAAPSDLLTKPARLNGLEYSLIKMHAEAGHDLLKRIAFPWPIAEIAWQHHERLDGSGYPRGLKGEEILLEARIVAVADVVEAMASHRPYRAALGVEAALTEVIRLRGGALDGAAVDACVRLFREQGYCFGPD